MCVCFCRTNEVLGPPPVPAGDSDAGTDLAGVPAPDIPEEPEPCRWDSGWCPGCDGTLSIRVQHQRGTSHV